MNIDYKENTDTSQPLIISYLSLRKLIGLLGISLPTVCIAGSYIFSSCKAILPSMSQYYYSVMGDYFVGTLFGVAMFLFSYKGYDKWDRILTNVAGFCAVLSALFPTHIAKLYLSCYVTDRDSSNFSDVMHTVSSALFLITLGLLSVFQFTKSGGNMTPQKRMRNKVYKVCGWLMLASILLIGLYRIPIIHPYFERYKLTYYLEALALLSFGFSWLTKGEFLLKDE